VLIFRLRRIVGINGLVGNTLKVDDQGDAHENNAKQTRQTPFDWLDTFSRLGATDDSDNSNEPYRFVVFVWLDFVAVSLGHC
jgi:hypothetical protein